MMGIRRVSYGSPSRGRVVQTTDTKEEIDTGEDVPVEVSETAIEEEIATLPSVQYPQDTVITQPSRGDGDDIQDTTITQPSRGDGDDIQDTTIT